MKKTLLYLALGVGAMAYLGVRASMTTLDVDYRSVQLWEDPDEDRRDMKEQLRFTFTSQDDLFEVAKSEELWCRLEFPQCQQLSGFGSVRRGPSDLARSADAQGSSRTNRSQFTYQADLILGFRDLGTRSINAREALLGRDHGDAQVIVYRPAMLFAFCSSDAIVVPAAEVAATVAR